MHSFITQSNPTWREVYDWMEDMCGPLKDYHWEEVAEVYKEFKKTLINTDTVAILNYSA